MGPGRAAEPAAATPPPRRPGSQGRPEATTHADIERAAFALFFEHGFAATTLDDVAVAVGVGRRTLFRYFPSKNDIPWGQFDRTLDGFRAILDGLPPDLPLPDAVHLAVRRFNEFPADARPSHRDRMQLILRTPELQAHSVLRYAEWRQVIAGFVAARLGLRPDDLLPVTVGQVSLALTLSAYEQWLAQPGRSLPALIDEAMTSLRTYLAG